MDIIIIQGSILLEKLVFSENANRTSMVIPAIAHISQQISELQGHKNGKGSEIRSLSHLVEQRYIKSNKFIEGLEKIIEYIQTFPEVREFLNDEGNVGTQGK